MKNYVLNLLIALDQSVNAIFGGYPDETISIHAARDRNNGARWGCVMCKFLDLFQKDHCDRTIESKRASLIARHLS